MKKGLKKAFKLMMNSLKNIINKQEIINPGKETDSLFATEKNIEMNANSELAQLFKSHGFSIEKQNGKLMVKTANEIFIESRLNQTQLENVCQSRLDVIIGLPNGQTIIESFGDIGENSENAKNKNVQNFALNSFHVISAFINEVKNDNQITYEEWEADENEWEVFIGNFGIRATTNKPIIIPEELFDLMMTLIKQTVNKENDYYWVRLFVAQFNNEISAIEFLINNHSFEPGKLTLSKLPWDLRDDFYSIRNFMMIKKKAAQIKG